VARKLVEAHGGAIGVESPPKSQPEHGRHFAGSRFWFEVKPVPLPTDAAADSSAR
jgi:hypothetical protein